MPGTPAVLFDLDGTLIDTIELILASARHALSDRSHPIPPDEEWLRSLGTPLVEQLRAYAADDADLGRLIDRYREFQLRHHDRLTRCYDGVLTAVGALHVGGHPLGVVTSKASAIARRSLEFVGLAGFFEAVVGYEDTRRHKPHPDPVLAALDQLGVEAPNAAFVGDSPFDVEAGNAAGVVTVAALWGPFRRETLAAARPDYYIGRIEELAPVLEQAFRSGGSSSPGRERQRS